MRSRCEGRWAGRWGAGNGRRDPVYEAVMKAHLRKPSPPSSANSQRKKS